MSLADYAYTDHCIVVFVNIDWFHPGTRLDRTIYFFSIYSVTAPKLVEGYKKQFRIDPFQRNETILQRKGEVWCSERITDRMIQISGILV